MDTIRKPMPDNRQDEIRRPFPERQPDESPDLVRGKKRNSPQETDEAPEKKIAISHDPE